MSRLSDKTPGTRRGPTFLRPRFIFHMPKPRTPTNVLALKGAFAHNPDRGRARAAEPEPVGEIGDPPDHLDELARDAWRELVKHAHAGVLCAADRPFMEYAAKVWAQIKASPEVDPKLGIRFESIIGRLGMSPADRSKVSAIKPRDGKDDPLAEFA